MTPTLEQLTIADSPEAWRRCGFTVVGNTCAFGEVLVEFASPDAPARRFGYARRNENAARGVVGFGVGGTDRELDGVDGLPIFTVEPGSAPSPVPTEPHANGVAALDHVVAIAPDLDRTIAALEHAGLDLRRVREEPTPAGAPRQAFFRVGEPILEVVQAPPEAIERTGGPDGPAIFWGVALVAPDLDATVAAIGADLVSGPRDAVQPGRRIATLRREAGLALPVALMTPAT